MPRGGEDAQGRRGCPGEARLPRGGEVIYFSSHFQSQMADKTMFYTIYFRVTILLVCQKSYYFFLVR
jgi:hypothetical protein